MALCCLLAFWTGGDAQRVDRLFRQSGLMRDKWDEVHYADGRTYGEVTVQRALRVTDERYDPSEAPDPDASSAAPDPAALQSIADEPDAADTPRSGDVEARSHLQEENALLRQRVREQADRIATLEDQLATQSSVSDGSES